MQLTRNFIALIFCLTLVTSCTVEELENDIPQTIEEVQATGDDDNSGDNGKGGG